MTTESRDEKVGVLTDIIDEAEYHSDDAKEALTEVVEETGKVASLNNRPENHLRLRVDTWLRYIDEWLTGEATSDAIVFAVESGMEWSINESEVKGLAWAWDNFDLVQHGIVREQSPDFVVGNRIGVEVKSKEKYTLQKAQLHAAQVLDRLHIVVANENDVWLEDTVDWIGLNEMERLS